MFHRTDLRTLSRIVLAASLLTVSMIPLAAAPIPITAPIQWTAGSGGNGHYYQLWKETNDNGGIAWTTANTFATSIGGYLVTFAAGSAGTGASEEVFVNSTFDPLMPAGSGNAGGTCCPHFWIGLSESGANSNVFQWVTGEPLVYTHWNPGEPNNLGNELYVADRWQNVNWNNLPNTAFSPASFFVVESTAPEPSSIALMTTGVLVLFMRMKRHRVRPTRHLANRRDKSTSRARSTS